MFYFGQSDMTIKIVRNDVCRYSKRHCNSSIQTAMVMRHPRASVSATIPTTFASSVVTLQRFLAGITWLCRFKG